MYLLSSRNVSSIRIMYLCLYNKEISKTILSLPCVSFLNYIFRRVQIFLVPQVGKNFHCYITTKVKHICCPFENPISSSYYTHPRLHTLPTPKARNFLYCVESPVSAINMAQCVKLSIFKLKEIVANS